MEKEILKLREEGKTYNEIVEILGCSKSTVSYYCGEGQKEKNLKRNQRYRMFNPLSGKVEKFRNFEFKVRDFQKECDEYNDLVRKGLDYSVQDVLNKIGDEPKCYLTGRKIDLYSPSTYHLDHIQPRKKGGGNELINLGLACREANFAKSDMTIEEFLILCKEVLENNGYIVNKQ